MAEWEAEEAVDADWEADSGGLGELSETAFKSVMFELAQTWTPGTDPAEYATLLQIAASGRPSTWRVIRRSARAGRPRRACFGYSRGRL